MENVSKMSSKELYARKIEITDMFASVGRTEVKEYNGKEFTNIKSVWYNTNGWAFDIMAAERKTITTKVVSAVKAKIGLSQDAFVGYTAKMVKQYEEKGQSRNLKIAGIINQNIAKLTNALMEANGYIELKEAQIEYFEIVAEMKARRKLASETASKIDDLDNDLDLDINMDDMIADLDGLDDIEI